MKTPEPIEDVIPAPSHLQISGHIEAEIRRCRSQDGGASASVNSPEPIQHIEQRAEVPLAENTRATSVLTVAAPDHDEIPPVSIATDRTLREPVV